MCRCNYHSLHANAVFTFSFFTTFHSLFFLYDTAKVKAWPVQEVYFYLRKKASNFSTELVNNNLWQKQVPLYFHAIFNNRNFLVIS